MAHSSPSLDQPSSHDWRRLPDTLDSDPERSRSHLLTESSLEASACG
ncbi:hypothetical protein [Streptomyces virginiae]|nr:hypothetical protein OG253_23515 [Streptomyces virginiae]